MWWIMSLNIQKVESLNYFYGNVERLELGQNLWLRVRFFRLASFFEVDARKTSIHTWQEGGLTFFMWKEWKIWPMRVSPIDAVSHPNWYSKKGWTSVSHFESGLSLLKKYSHKLRTQALCLWVVRQVKKLASYLNKSLVWNKEFLGKRQFFKKK